MARPVTDRPGAEPWPDADVFGYPVTVGSLPVLLPVLPVVAQVRLYDASARQNRRA